MFLNGQGIPQSKTEALNFYGKACDLKDQESCDEFNKLKTGK
jgi:TPR repeat protein